MGYRPAPDPRPALHRPVVIRPPRSACRATAEALRRCPMCGCEDDPAALTAAIGGWPAHPDCADLHHLGLRAARP